MDSLTAVAALAALGQTTRLEVFRLLLLNVPNGLAAGEIAARVGTPQNTMSNHLSVLAKAGLVTSRRHSQQIIYGADLQSFGGLSRFLKDLQKSPRPDAKAS